ncbi:unnamed protein product [Didymodactylos carnosus]|uniref:protein-tyrosine-phosphatase n=1 Tax=Didymodactylos carnosus TaxID=1234261 RepID=A0A814LD47_9BILA|nr:unnamed protein product [Didymodactylos carnosus]CAF1061766.1 unnamed protein product [Didymodactylos carnosus]CAF3791679.1 unnamed protein product [Didymodactylos carnosus]CAF3829990.1 unnamed protein product [Didymodactylos carnosus]
MSEQCLSIMPNAGPSQILPFLFLGSQEDVMSTKTMLDYQITHIINVSSTCPKAPSIADENDEHFLRIPINDSLNAQLIPYFDQAYNFIEKARLSNGHVFIHSGISRSPALAVAYIMKYMGLSADDAYRQVLT